MQAFAQGFTDGQLNFSEDHNKQIMQARMIQQQTYILASGP